MRKLKVVMQKIRNPAQLAAAQEKMRRRHGGVIARAGAPVYQPGAHVAEERHFTPTEIAKMWGVSVWTVRKMFANVPGVLKIGNQRQVRFTSHSCQNPAWLSWPFVSETPEI